MMQPKTTSQQDPQQSADFLSLDSSSAVLSRRLNIGEMNPKNALSELSLLVNMENLETNSDELALLSLRTGALSSVLPELNLSLARELSLLDKLEILETLENPSTDKLALLSPRTGALSSTLPELNLSLARNLLFFENKENLANTSVRLDFLLLLTGALSSDSELNLSLARDAALLVALDSPAIVFQDPFMSEGDAVELVWCLGKYEPSLVLLMLAIGMLSSGAPELNLFLAIDGKDGTESVALDSSSTVVPKSSSLLSELSSSDAFSTSLLRSVIMKCYIV